MEGGMCLSRAAMQPVRSRRLGWRLGVGLGLGRAGQRGFCCTHVISGLGEMWAAAHPRGYVPPGSDQERRLFNQPFSGGAELKLFTQKATRGVSTGARSLQQRVPSTQRWTDCFYCLLQLLIADPWRENNLQMRANGTVQEASTRSLSRVWKPASHLLSWTARKRRRRKSCSDHYFKRRERDREREKIQP